MSHKQNTRKCDRCAFFISREDGMAFCRKRPSIQPGPSLLVLNCSEFKEPEK